MRIIKPLRLGLLNKPYRWQGENRLGVAVLAIASMEDSPQLRPDVELWNLLRMELGASDGVVDLGYPKPHPEFLATGYAFTGQQDDKTRCEVAIQVDGLRKRLQVSGARHWLEQGYSEPQAFERIRLDWSTAYGGPSYADNPFGIGATDQGVVPLALPHVESPDALLTAPGQEHPAAGFGPLGLQWPCRHRLAGQRYDPNWLATRFPGFAEDFDPRFFNMASADQIRLDQSQWSPGAPYAITGMHPQRPCMEGRLPAWQARCFINRRIGSDEVFEEIGMRHTTVWFFPHLEQMVLVYHGSTHITEDDAHDVGSLMPALEPVATPREMAHYRKVWLKRQDEQTRASCAFEEADLLPAESIGPWIDSLPTAQTSPLQANMEARRQNIEKEHGIKIEPDEDANPPTNLSELPAFKAKLEARAEEEKQKVHAAVRAKGFDPEQESQPEARPRGPQSLKDMNAALERQAKSLPESLPPAQLAAAKDSLHQMYLQAVEAQAKPPRLSAEASAKIRQQVQARLDSDRNLDGMDLTGADLSGLNLSRCSMQRSLLENADLSHCVLDHADLGEAVLARAELRQASLREARLDKASMFQADCTGSDFAKASLQQTRLQEAMLQTCNFVGCRIDGITVSKTFFVECRFDQARISNLVLNDALLRQCSFTTAWLHRVAFNNSLLDEIDFSEAEISNCTWVSCQVKAVFRSSKMRNSSLALASELRGADFSSAQLLQCNFRGIALDAANFRSAKAHGCDFSEASMLETNFTQADASDSLFSRSDLQGSTFENAKLFSTSMPKAKLLACNFRGANLFRADLSQIETDAATDWEGSYTVQTIKTPRPKAAATP